MFRVSLSGCTTVLPTDGNSGNSGTGRCEKIDFAEISSEPKCMPKAQRSLIRHPGAIFLKARVSWTEFRGQSFRVPEAVGPRKLLGNNRDYRTADRRAYLLARHERMRALEAHGLTRVEASRWAFRELSSTEEREPVEDTQKCNRTTPGRGRK
jgi:hypothetical protein